MNISISIKKILFTIGAIIFLNYQISADELVITQHHKINKGYSSSYQPKQSGEIVTDKNNYNDDYFSEDGSKSLTEKLNVSRGILNEDEKQFIDLREYFEILAYEKKAPRWVGNCDKWSAAALDDTINSILNNTKGIVCNGVILKPKDLKELFTAIYPTNPEESIFYGKKYVKDESQTKKWNEMDDKLENFFGFTSFLPHIFHINAHENLSKDQGVVIDDEPSSDERWNQPIVEVNSIVKVLPATITGTYIKSHQDVIYEADVYAPIAGKKNPNYKNIMNNLKLIKSYSTIFKNLYNKRDKDSSFSLLEFIKQQSKTDLPEDFKEEILKIISAKHLSTDDEIMAELSIERSLLFRKSIQWGLQYNPAFKVKLVTDNVRYLKEVPFRADSETFHKTFNEQVPLDQTITYKYLVFERVASEDTKTTVFKSEIYSYWKTDKERTKRPGVMWKPVCYSDKCTVVAEDFRKKALSFKGKNAKLELRIFLKQNGFKTELFALNELLNLFKKCIPIEKAKEDIQALFKLIDSIDDNKFVETDVNKVVEKLKDLIARKIPYSSNALGEHFKTKPKLIEIVKTKF
ncbi:MAG: hypothetical protein HQK51_07220 [Oligoflexia bacterium]|nr:hypothetical protein [Oligoflexia bacterium]